MNFSRSSMSLISSTVHVVLSSTLSVRVSATSEMIAGISEDSAISIVEIPNLRPIHITTALMVSGTVGATSLLRKWFKNLANVPAEIG